MVDQTGPSVQQAIANLETVSDDFSMDEDIRAFFVEEAVEIQDNLAQLLPKWLLQLNDKSLLKEIRRAFHTLKGSGRMVGAHQLAELAWSCEHLLNRVLDYAVPVHELMGQLLQQVQLVLPALIEQFAAAQPASIDVQGLKAVANLLSQNTIPATHELPWLTQPATPATAVVEASPVPASTLEVDAEGLRIFVSEAGEHIAVIQQYLTHAPVDEPVPDTLIRALHTLRGSSAMSGIESVRQLASSLEEELKRLMRQHLPVTTQHVHFLERLLQQLDVHIAALQQGNLLALSTTDLSLIHDVEQATDNAEQTTATLTPSTQGLVAQILSLSLDELLDAEYELSAQLQSSNASAYLHTLAQQSQQLSALTDSKPVPALQQLAKLLLQVYAMLEKRAVTAIPPQHIAALTQAHAALTAMFDALAASQQPVLDPVIPQQLQAIVEQDNHQPDATNSDSFQPSNPSSGTALPIDEELLEIFLDEADELIEGIDSSFDRWQQQPGQMQPLKNLQRHLHTLKGGARMVQLTGLGDLAHEMETVYDRLLAGTLSISPVLLHFMRHAQYVMSAQIEQLRHYGKIVDAATEVHALQQFLQLGDEQVLQQVLSPTTTAEQLPSAASTDIEASQQTSLSFDSEAAFQHLLHAESLVDLPTAAYTDQTQFIEDAQQWMVLSQQCLLDWLDKVQDKRPLLELQRSMHMLRCAATNQQVPAIASMAEELELVYEDLAALQLVSTTNIGQLLQLSQAWLLSAIDQLQQHEPVALPEPLIKALQAFQQHPHQLIDLPIYDARQHAFKQQQVQMPLFEQAVNIVVQGDGSEPPPMQGLFEAPVIDASALNNEMIRISAELMEKMINLSAENAINRSRVEMDVSGLKSTLSEMGQTIQHLAEQLRRMDGELETQIRARHEQTSDADFDPLELDRYSSLDQLSKSLTEAASDLLDFKTTLADKIRDAEDLLLQQARIQSELQDGLMNARLVPFSRLVPRLQRVVRQTAADLGKSVELVVENAEDELDRNILEHMIAPLEHMVRNAIDHGLETTEERLKANKPAQGSIHLTVTRQGNEIVLCMADDGRGIPVQAVRQKAIEQGLISADSSMSDESIMQLIFHGGLSTAQHITQISGRGVGMDVVQHEIRLLGGAISVASRTGLGTEFIIRLPLTVAVTDALMVCVADQQYAIPLTQIERIVRVSPQALDQYYQSDAQAFVLDGKPCRLHYLGEFIHGAGQPDLTKDSPLPVLLIKSQGQSVALQVDQLTGSRAEIVVKPVGQQLAPIAIIAGATIMGDGTVAIILDAQAISRSATANRRQPVDLQHRARSLKTEQQRLVMVVDDSVTVRKVTTRLLERHGYKVMAAKDGVEALSLLQTVNPDILLLDIEMPRMDGYEVLSQVRHHPQHANLPVIMITSRIGEKHRDRAMQMKVTDYLGKPFQEQELLQRMDKLLQQVLY